MESGDWFANVSENAAPYRLDPVLESTAAPNDPFVEGAAAMVLGFSFLGFFASRFPRCSPLAIASRSE